MKINTDRVFANLDEFEQIQIEIEAEGRGVETGVVVMELVRDGIQICLEEGMDEVFQPTDRQWKSH